MYFTQDDYRKIEQWLSKNSVKDTEFNEAITPFNGNETVAIVQNGHNAKASMSDIVKQMFLLGVSDFLNVTDKYGEKYITLTDAIRLIPYMSRKIGQVITFLNPEGNWELYQFQGESILQWNNNTLWVDLLAEVAAKVNVVPDEEDITGVLQGGRNLLKFKDKNYNKDDYSGLGRVFLRKNLTTVTDPSTMCEISTNLLTQEMISREYTIYIIQYDYTLNGNTIVIPKGSILDFQGGSIDNGTLSFKDDTKIKEHFIGNAIIEGNPLYIDYVADEEDITSLGGVAKFKDKEYNASEFSGLGRVYLRKNISNGKNILTQDMINKPNTIYEIRYDFDLNSAEITIPEGCVLDFKGGILSNGTILGNNSTIIASLNKIFDLNTEISGTWDISEAYPEWFGAKGDGNTDSTQSIKLCLASFYTTNLSAKSRYLITTPIILDSSYTIKGEGFSSQIIGSPECFFKGEATGSNYIKDVVMRDFSIIGDGTNIGMDLGNFSLATIDNVSIWTTKIGVTANDIWQVSFKDVISRNLPQDPVQDVGFKFSLGTSIVMTRCWARRCKIGFSLGAIMYSSLCSCVVENFSERGYTGGQQCVFMSCGAESANLIDDGCVFHFQYRQHTLIGASLFKINSIASAEAPASIIRCIGANVTVMGIRGEAAVTGDNVSICKCTDYGTVNIYNCLITTVGTPIVASNGNVVSVRGSSISSYGTPISYNEMPKVDGYKIIDIVEQDRIRLIKFADGTFICSGIISLEGTDITTPYTMFGLNAFTTESTIQFTLPSQVLSIYSFSANICTYSNYNNRDAFVVTSNAFTSNRAIFGLKPILSQQINSVENNLTLHVHITGKWV